MKKRTKVILIIIGVVILGLVIALFSIPRKNGALGMLSTEIKTTTVTKGDLKAYLSTTAVIQSENSKEYQAQQFKATKVNVKVGDSVKKGDILVTYDISDINNSVKQAELQYDNSVLSKNEIVNIPNVSKEKIQQADNTVALAKISLDSATNKKKSAGSVIEADFDGVVTAVNVVEGSVGSGATMSPAIIIKDLNNLKAVAELGKFDISKVKLGQAVTIKSVTNNTYIGTISFIDPVATKSLTAAGGASTVGIEIKIDGTPTDLKIDFDADIDILIGEVNNTLIVPMESVKNEKGYGDYVFTHKDNKVTKTKITLGLQSDSQAEVKEGLSNGQTIILNPPANMKDGDTFKIPTKR